MKENEKTKPPILPATAPAGCIMQVSIDNIVFGVENGRLMVLVARYKAGNAGGRWGLLGGWIENDEHIDAAARRIVHAITGVENLYLEQLRAFGEPDRYPEERIITLTYYALVKPEDYHLIPGSAVSEVKWWDARALPDLIYDHAEQIRYALAFLENKVRYEPVGFNLLPEKFTLLELQNVYESILNRTLDKPNFRRKINKMNLLIDCNEKQTGVTHRAANLFRFDPVVYQKLCEHGFNFEF